VLHSSITTVSCVSIEVALAGGISGIRRIMVCCGGLPDRWPTENDIRATFSVYGNVIGMFCVKVYKRNKIFGYLTMFEVSCHLASLQYFACWMVSAMQFLTGELEIPL